MNIVEILFHFVWFACGFIPGYLVAQQRGMMPGLIVGFIAFLLTLFTIGRVQVAVDRKRRGRSNKS